MAIALAPPSSSNTKHWWPRLSPNKEPSLFSPGTNLYDSTPGNTGSRPHAASGTSGPSLMNSVTNPNTTSSNAFTAKSSRFNLAAVIGFGSKSKKQQQVDLSDPPSQLRSIPTPNSNAHREWGVPHSSTNPRLSHGVASSGSGTSRASTDWPLTPADDPSNSSSRTSYQHSLMTITDLGDPFASSVPLSERRSSAHSDKSLSRRLLQKIDGKTPKTSARLPISDGSKKDSRERSATLPSRARASTDASEAYQALVAVEPPWATSEQSEPLSKPMSSPRAATRDHSKTVRGFSDAVTLKHSKSSIPALPWPPTPATREKGVLQLHQRTHSSSSIAKQYVTDSTRTHTRRPSTSSSITSPSSLTFPPSHLSFSSNSPGSLSGYSADEHQVVMPSLGRTSSASAQTTPTSPHSARTNPRPPPTTGLPPTPTLAQPSGSLLPPRLHPPPSPSGEQRSLRSRSGTTSSMSFASSLSSLSFNSRPSPQDPPAVDADDYPSLLNETLPGAGVDTVAPQRSRNPKSSGSRKDSRVQGSTLAPTSPRDDGPPKPAKTVLPGTRPLPSPPSSPRAVNVMKRECTLSVTSSTSDVGRTLRKQRSFHNTSLRAPTSLQPPLRHHNSYSSLDPSTWLGDHARSPPLPSLRSPPMSPLRSPPLPPPQDLPPPPPPLVGTSKHSNSGKDSGMGPSPRRKLFGVNKHDRDRDRERKQELDNVDTSLPTGSASPRHGSASSSGPAQPSSLWYDDRGTSSEPPSASSTSPSTTHDVAQHIVPPAELLRLGAEWERENESRNGLRRAKSSWESHESKGSRTSFGSSLRAPIQSSPRDSSPPAPSSSSKLPRSSSLLSKASSAPSFSRAHGPPLELSFGPSSSAVPPDSHTSLSPPPPRRQRTLSRTSQQISSGLPAPPHRTPSTSSAVSSSSKPPKGALIERKPSFLDMTTSRQSVTLDVPDPSDREEYERDSFLELSRGKNSIETIRESIGSMDSFMQ